MTNSRAKGKNGELAWAAFCRDQGFDARRGQQFKGTKDSPDIESKALAMFHPEVKRVERLNIQDAIDKAISEADGKIPYVAHRRNHCDWLVTMTADDWFNLVRSFIEDKGATL